MPGWYVYIVRCRDGSLYTGITTDLDRRVREHNGSSGLGARYTRSRQPVQLVYIEEHDNRSLAARREYAIKSLLLKKKKALIQGDIVVLAPG